MMRIWMSLMSGKTTEKIRGVTEMGKRSQNKRNENVGSKKVKYETIAYDCGEVHRWDPLFGHHRCPHDQSFKTLVMEGKKRQLLVFAGSDRGKKWTKMELLQSLLKRQTVDIDPCKGVLQRSQTPYPRRLQPSWNEKIIR